MSRRCLALVALCAAISGCQQQDPGVHESLAFLTKESVRQDEKLIELQIQQERLQREINALNEVGAANVSARIAAPEPMWVLWRIKTSLPGRMGFIPGPAEAIDSIETKDRCLSAVQAIVQEAGGNGQTYYTDENTISLTCLPQGVSPKSER